MRISLAVVSALIGLWLSSAPDASSASSASIGDDPAAAERAFREGRYDDASRHYAALARENPENRECAFRLAHSLHMQGDFRASIQAHDRASRFEEVRAVCLYNMACAHARLGEADAAFSALRRALDEGFADVEALETDTDLASLREDARFAALIRRPAGGSSPHPPLTWSNLEDRLRAEEAAGFSGAVHVVRDGRVVLSRGYGLANREKNVACTADSVFAIGSTPIDFTHVGILLLEQRGEISFADRVGKYIEGVPADKAPITIEHLMTGRSGVRDFHDIPEDRDPDHAYIDRDEAMRRIFSGKLLFEPGTDRRHSHSAWGVLAAICEIASGKTYPEFVRSEIFEPAGMKDTGFNGEAIPEKRLAIGYGVRSDGEVNAPPHWGPTSWLVMGSGGQLSTVGDLDRFQRALRGGRILAPEGVARYYGPRDGRGVAAAGDMYGFEIRYTQGPSDRMILVTNSARPGSAGRRFERLTRDLAALVLGEGGEPKRAAAKFRTFPRTLQGRRARAFFAALASSDAEDYVRFGREHRSASASGESVDRQRREQHAEFRRQWGDLDVVEIAVESPETLRVVARASAADEELTFVFDYASKSDRRIERIEIRSATDH